MGNILNFLLQGLRLIGALICNLIYSLIATFYQLFMTISKINILSSDQIQPIYQRVTMILTIVMVFYITFEFVKYVLEPEKMLDKEKGMGNIAVRMIVVVLLIAFVPTIFSTAYKIQNAVIDNQVFSKVLLGRTEGDFNKIGNSFSANMLGLFYGIDPIVCEQANCSGAQISVDDNLNRLKDTGIANIRTGINESVKTSAVGGETEEAFMIKFDGVMALFVGGFILYVLGLYAINLGTRYVQLIFLQIMSPIAIISYISPKKDNMFSKWTKQCLTTYLDLFIRLAIIYFILLIVEVLGDAFAGDLGQIFEGMGEIGTSIKILTYIALVMGLLLFASKAPNLLSDLFGKSGVAGIGFGLSAKERLAPTGKAIRGVASATGKTLAAAAVAPRALIGSRGRPWSALKAMGRGYANVFGKNGGLRSSRQAIRASLNEDMDTRAAGGNPFVKSVFGGGAAIRAKAQDMEIAKLDDYAKKRETVKSSANEIKIMKKLKEQYDVAVASGDRDAAATAQANLKSAEKLVYKMALGDANAQADLVTMATNNGLSINDLEVGNAKWGVIKTNIEKAQNAGKEIKNSVTYDANGEKITIKDKYGEGIFNSGNIIDFADSIGDIKDDSDAAKNMIQTSSDYISSHANAEKQGK